MESSWPPPPPGAGLAGDAGKMIHCTGKGALPHGVERLQVDVELTAADLKRLHEVRALALEYPGWMFSMQGTDHCPGQIQAWLKVMKK